MHLSVNQVAIFLMNPLISLAMALQRIRSPSTKNIIWMFCAFYGTAFYVDMETSVDSVKYIRGLQDMYLSDISFSSLTKLFYQEGERHYDIFAPIVTFVVSRFTDDYRVFMGVVGAVFGFFYSRVIFFFVDRFQFKTSYIEWYLLALIAFSLDVGTAINGVRMYVAMFVFLYGALQYLESRKTSHLLWAMASVFFHFSFFIPVAILVAERYLTKLHGPIYLFFIGSFIFAELDIGAIRSVVQALPLGLETRVGGYLYEYDPQVRELTWLIDANRRMMQLFMIAMVTHFYMNFVVPNRNQYSSFVIYTMLLYGTVNMLWQAGSIIRFYVLAEIIFIGYFALQLNWYRQSIKDYVTITTIAVPLLALQLALGIRFFLGFASTSLLLGNPVVVWFFEGSTSLYQFIPRFW